MQFLVTGKNGQGKRSYLFWATDGDIEVIREVLKNAQAYLPNIVFDDMGLRNRLRDMRRRLSYAQEFEEDDRENGKRGLPQVDEFYRTHKECTFIADEDEENYE